MYVLLAIMETFVMDLIIEYHDLVYYYWQESFLKQFIKIFNPKKLIKKIHKKDTLAPKQNLLNISYEKEKDFFELVDQSNLFIFDYPSTAFTMLPLLTSL